MRVLVTGSSGHLGEALVRTLAEHDHEVVGLDVRPSPFTCIVGSIGDSETVRIALEGTEAVIHTATLHKPHVETHTRQEFVDTNVTGTLKLLEASAAAGVGSFVFTSTTSTFGRALTPPSGAPAVWVTEDLRPVPRNIYGVTKVAAEDLCELVHRNAGLPCVVLLTSRFFPEEDDDPRQRAAFSDGNLKAIEYLYRRVELEDVVAAHLLAVERGPSIGFGRYIVSATSPFARTDLAELRSNAPAVVARLFPDCQSVLDGLGWRMTPTIDRVYVNDRARKELGWQPKYDFGHVLDRLRSGRDPRSDLARAVGSKGYERSSKP